MADRDLERAQHKPLIKDVGSVKHRDAYGRTREIPAADHANRYLDPASGKLRILAIQQSEALHCRWPWAIQVLNWIWRSQNQQSDKHSVVRKLWLPGALALAMLCLIPSNFEPPMVHGGMYDRIQYRDWCYAEVARNTLESRNSDAEDKFPTLPPRNSGLMRAGHSQGPDGVQLSELTRETAHVVSRPQFVPRKLVQITRANQSSSMHSQEAPMPGTLERRSLAPMILGFITGDSTNPTVTFQDVHEWRNDNPGKAPPRYCFVSYTASQFDTHNECQSPDRTLLESYGARAALDAGAHAIWLDYACVPKKFNHESEPEAWRICDIVRAAYLMIIVTGPALTLLESELVANVGLQTHQHLAIWGSRLWTLPELLLCPSPNNIPVYTRGGEKQEGMTRRHLTLMLDDGEQVRELVDHYESSTHLTQLELMSLSAHIMFRRLLKRKNPGDVSYALMGLMRRRPKVDTSDSEFKAFARLSLANDSDQLMERSVCMLPLSKKMPWYDMTDAYGAKLWDIEPCCQIAGLTKPSVTVQERTALDHGVCAEDETHMLVLDGAFGAAIRWDSIRPVPFTKRRSELRTVAKVLVRAYPAYFYSGLSLIAKGVVSNVPELWLAGAAILAGCVILSLLLPYFLRRLYQGKMWTTQAQFFGIEGLPDLQRVEHCLFGSSENRLRWSTHGSLLSRATCLPDGEYRELPPDTSGRGKQEGQTLYTIVDSFTLTASAFYADRPPTAVIICGQEGGMQRALLCSYDPRNRAFCREAVLRMKTLCLERMSRIDRFRFALRRYE